MHARIVKDLPVLDQANFPKPPKKENIINPSPTVIIDTWTVAERIAIHIMTIAIRESRMWKPISYTEWAAIARTLAPVRITYHLLDAMERLATKGLVEIVMYYRIKYFIPTPTFAQEITGNKITLKII